MRHDMVKRMKKRPELKTPRNSVLTGQMDEKVQTWTQARDPAWGKQMRAARAR